MASGPFSKIPLDPDRVHPALEGAGVVELKMREVSVKERHYTGTFNGTPVMVRLYVNGGGNCTIGYAPGFDRPTFDELARLIAEQCRWGQAARLEISIKDKAADAAKLIEALTGRGALVEGVSAEKYSTASRVRGPAGDVLMVKAYQNGTLQLQGKHAQTATWALDFLRGLMPLDEVLEQQRAVYKLPITVEAVKSELQTRVPYVHDKLADEVRIQLSSALALTKVDIALEDYAALAFPALRGLEGFCLQLLREDCGFTPLKKAELGEYFELATGGLQYLMRPIHRQGVAETLQNLLQDCYTTWHKQRHSLFHMSGALETSRIIEDRAEAIAVVNQVFDTIDAGYGTHINSK